MNAEAPRLWPGSTVVCLGCGPSLTVEDVAYVRGKSRVIAINSAYQIAPWADVLYSSDRQWWAQYRGAPDFEGMKYAIGSGRGRHDSILKSPDVTVLKNTGDEGLDLSPDSLRAGRNSGAAAINLAVHVGATRILLLGYNMAVVDGQRHFFGNYPPALQHASPFALFLKMFATMVAPLKAAGVEVINCTEPSALTCFPRAALRDVLVEPAESISELLEAAL